MLEANRKEAGELYVFFSLLGRGEVSCGDALGKARREAALKKVLRRERGEECGYVVEEDTIRMEGSGHGGSFPRQDFSDAAEWLLERLTKTGEAEGDLLDISPIEPFLDALGLYDMEAQTDDRTDLRLVLSSPQDEPLGIAIQNRLAGYKPLLGGGRVANLKYEQTGIRFSAPALHKINWSERPDDVAEVARRILYVQSMGGVFKYSDVADKVFKSNLLMLDTNLPRILASMLMTLHLDDLSRISEHAVRLEEQNPLKLKDELVRRHGFYRYKLRQLLSAAAWGMRSTKMWDGRMGSVDGYLMVGGDGGMLLYTKADEQTFCDYLFAHTRLEIGSPEADHYGMLERENGAYFLKLNLRIGLLRK